MNKLTEEIKNVLSASEKKLKSIDEFNSSKKPLPDKWSSKETLGHLIDSSINNTIRFINGQFKGDLIFSGYDHLKWVERQNHQNAGWNFLIELWKLNNLQIVRIIESIPSETLSKKHSNHNFDEIAWKEVDKSEPATLLYLIEDYLGHMKHHLNQIFRMNKLDEI